MSLNFPQDTSVQLSYSSFPFTTTSLDNYTTSNYVSNISNVLINNINTKQPTLTAATTLLGIGSSISALDYSKITLNKPSFFPADWTTTISNKPSTFPADMTNIYTKTETNNLLSAKQNTLTASTILSGIGSNLTLVNYNTLSNLPSIYSRTESDNRYLQLTGGTLTNNLNVNANITTQQLYINNPTSTASIIFSPNPSIYSIFSRRVPWAMYFAEDYNASSPTLLPNYINNGRDATLGGTAVTKTTLAGNGALGAITYISGTTTSTILFPTGSIPETFTILTLSRYVGPNRRRIFQASTNNILHGHWGGNRGVAHYDAWKTAVSTIGNLDDWLCFIGKNVGGTPGNILADGTPRGTAPGGTGNLRLSVNTGGQGGETSEFQISCVMIWDTTLTDAEMVDLNTIVNTYRNDGVSIKTLISSTIDDDSVIESRVYDGVEKTELLLFKGNDGIGANGADRIRLKAGNIAFDTYSSLTPSGNRNNENIVMLINENGNVGIGITTNITYKLNVNGSLNSTSFYQNGTLINFSSYATNTDLTTNYYTQTQTNTLLNAKQDTLTAATTLLGIGSSITAIDYSKITLNKPSFFPADWNTTISNKPSTFPADMTNIYTKTETNTLLSAKQATLTFSSPLVNTANTIEINLSSYSTTGNDTNYLLKSGGTMTGGLNFNNLVQNKVISLYDALTPNNFQYVGLGANSGLVLSCFGASDSFKFNVGTSTTQANTIMTLTGNGNLSTTGLINAGTNLQENGTNLSSKYLQLAGGNMTGSIGFGTSPDSKIHIATPDNIATTTNIFNFKNVSGYGIYATTTSIATRGNTLDFLSRDYNSGTITTRNILSLSPTGNVGIGITNPFASLSIGTPAASSDGTLTISKNSGGNRNFKFGYDGSFNFCMGDFGNGVSNNFWDSTQLNINWNSGNVGIGIASQSQKLYVNGSTYINGNTTINGELYLKNATWHRSIDNVYRTYYETNSISYYCCGANSADGHIFMNSGYAHVFKIKNNGDISNTGNIDCGEQIKLSNTIKKDKLILWYNTSSSYYALGIAGGTLQYTSDGSHKFYTNATNTMTLDSSGGLYVSGNVGIGTQPTYKKLEINGDTNCTGAFGITGDLSLYRGSGGIYGNLNCGGYITCLLYAITNSGTDYVGVSNATSGNNNNYLRQLYIMFETFTGFHRCFTSDELFDNENPQNFKDTYIGRIVVSTGKIATDFKSIDNDDWEIKYDKEGITIEDALPMIELSRKKKDKKVFGVLGNSKRNNSRSERMIVNSVGEGGIWVCNSNDNIENGDYITSSDYLGYGERQDDDILHNYTCAKATMDCNFELDSLLYNCFEIDDLDANGNKLRIAFIACTYHSG